MNGREHRDRELTRLSVLRLFLLCLDSLGSCGSRWASTEAQTVRKTHFFIENRKDRYKKWDSTSKIEHIIFGPRSNRGVGLVCGHYCSCSAPLPSLLPSLPGCSGIWVPSAPSSSFVLLSDSGAPPEGSCSMGVPSRASSESAGVVSAEALDVDWCGGGARLCFCW